jgi:hypothetical protein
MRRKPAGLVPSPAWLPPAEGAADFIFTWLHFLLAFSITRVMVQIINRVRLLTSRAIFI